MQRISKPKYGPVRLRRLPLAAAIWLAASTGAFAQDASGTQDPAAPTDATAQAPAAPPTPTPATPPPEARSATLETITVTAQKRAENVQKVPISMQVLSTEKLEQLNVKDFDDYVKYLPSVSYQSFGPGFSYVYMRGVASGGDGNHSGSLPSVGMYLDEEPITTIQGALDIHIYDIARVESLSGPQGTLYGASSEAGTIRIITNKPDPGVLAGG
jgi:iron complex outermembrane receptor protein